MRATNDQAVSALDWRFRTSSLNCMADASALKAQDLAGVVSSLCVFPLRSSTLENPLSSSNSAPLADRPQVLIVDDNQDAATSIGLLVSTLGGRPEVVNDGANALQLLQTYEPSLALLDIGMS